MYVLQPSLYDKVVPLITSRNDVTVLSALQNTIDNEVLVDNIEAPSCTLLKLPGSNYVAGSTANQTFVEELPALLDFWDQLTPDDDSWRAIISQCHPNRYIRQYTRCHYELSKGDWQNPSFVVPPEYAIEKVDLSKMRISSLRNEDKIYDWASDYRDDNHFMQNGVGFYVSHANQITNWSLSDGHYQEKIAIGVQSDTGFRRKGLSIAAVAATINECFHRGFTTIEWLCVDFNKGSRAIAEKLGFRLVNTYVSFTPFPPCENYHDLSEQDWNKWAEYYEAHSMQEPKLLSEQLLAYIKGNNDKKAKETIRVISEKYDAAAIAENQWLADLPNTIDYFHTIGMCSALSSNEWTDLLCLFGIVR